MCAFVCVKFWALRKKLQNFEEKKSNLKRLEIEI